MIRTYRVMRGFALNWGPYTDVAPGGTVEIPEQIARPFLGSGKLVMTTGNVAVATEANTGHVLNPDIIVTHDPIPAKISAAGGGKRRK